MFISDEELASLPEEPEQAFVALEGIVRARFETEWARLGDNESGIELQRRYMSIILPAARHYGIASLADWSRPGASDDTWQRYQQFFGDVDYCISELRLRNVERVKQHSVALDAATKIKMRHLLDQVRRTVDNLDVSVAKKDRLYSRINALQDEIDRERTRYQAFAALMIEATDDVGEAAKRLEPVVQMVERIGAALGLAKRDEDARPKLPPRQEPKRIEPPKRNTDRRADDEIPF